MAKIIDRTGEIHKGLKITKELGSNKVLSTCTSCGTTETYSKGSVVRDAVVCKKCTKSKLKNREGEVYRDLKIVEDIGGNKVKCKCIKCNNTETYIKSRLVSNKLICKNCGSFIRDNKTSEIHRNLKIIEELGGNKVLCKCIKCNHTAEYTKSEVIRDRTACKRCGVKIVRSREGETHRDLKVIEELGGCKVICKCTLCGHTDTYAKSKVVSDNVLCKKCGLYKNHVGKTINTIKITSLNYIGRNKKEYYNCRCTKCGEELILTREEIIKYTCTKKGY